MTRAATTSGAETPEKKTVPSPAPQTGAAKADDFDALKKSVEDAAAVSGGLWFSYLFVLLYLAIAAGAVSHIDLFLESAIKLPFLSGIELPMKAFFFLAPFILCITHVYTLTSFVFLGDKARRYHRALNAEIPGDGDSESEASRQAESTRNELRRQLSSNIFAQFVAGPDTVRSGMLGFVLKTIVLTTLIVAPVLVLLLLQLQFLPYHSRVITWTARLALLFDLIVVWWFWNAILAGFAERQHATRPISWLTVVLGVLGICVVPFSWAVATFPGEWLDGGRAFSVFPQVDAAKNRTYVSLHDFLFSQPVDPNTRRRGFFLSSTLVVSAFDIFEQLQIDPSKKMLGPYKYVFRARGRDFRGAVFDLSNLSNVDFEGASLQNASFDRATLEDSSLFCAKLQGAVLSNAQLRGTWFFGAGLQGAQLQSVEGQGALFEGAQLQGANLEGAKFQAASFQSANLDAASLVAADLDGASFERRDLDADCIKKEERDALPQKGADLQGAILDGASLRAASLEGAQLQGASLRRVKLDGADFADAFLWRTDLMDASPSGQTALFGSAIRDPREGDDSHAFWSMAAYDRLVARTLRDIPDVAKGRAREHLLNLHCDRPPAAREPCLDAAGLSVRTPPAAATPVDREIAYKALLADRFRKLVCSGHPKAIFVLRGLLATDRLAAAGVAATPLVHDIETGTAGCPSQGELGEFDRTNILNLKHKIEPDP